MGRKILILGASSGIGRAVAEYMARKGDDLFLAARRRDRLEELKNKYDQVQIIWDVDLSEEANVKRIFMDLKEKGIKLDGMVLSLIHI